MIIGLSKNHIQMMLQDMKRREERKARGEKDFMDYPYKEIAKALKNYLGRDDYYCVIYTFIDKETLGLYYQGQWINVSYEQLKIFL